MDTVLVVTLPCTINETVKWLTSVAAHLNAEITGGDNVAVKFQLNTVRDINIIVQVQNMSRYV